jgi:hypothetical protein
MRRAEILVLLVVLSLGGASLWSLGRLDSRAEERWVAPQPTPPRARPARSRVESVPVPIARATPPLRSNEPEPDAEAPVLEIPVVTESAPERCSLHLQVRDWVTGRALSGKVALWRLGIPGDAEWTAGDQLERVLHVPEEGAVVEDLPAGIYQAVSAARRRDGQDSPAFTVPVPGDRILLTVEARRRRPTYVAVFDSAGVPVPNVDVYWRSGSGAGTLEGFRPVWARPRERRGERMGRGGGGYVSSGSCSEWQAKEADERGWVWLGDSREDGPACRRLQHYLLRAAESCVVALDVGGEPCARDLYVTVAVEREEVLSRIRVPAGWPLGVLDAAEIEVGALRCPEGRDPASLWREVPIEVSLEAAGAGIVRATLRLGDAERPLLESR